MATAPLQPLDETATGASPSAASWSRITVLVIAAAAAAALALYALKARHQMPDFEVYWRAGARAAGAEPLYRVSDGHYQLKYFPAFAVLAVPLGTLPVEVARAAWFAVSVILLGVMLAVSVRLLPERRKPVWVLIALTIAVMAKFFARELMLGQINYFFTGAAAGALLALAHGRGAAAGGLGTLAIVFKPYGVVLLPWMLAHRNRGLTAAVVAGLATALLLPSLTYGVGGNLDLHREWWSTVVSTTAPNLLGPDNASWLAMYSRLFGIGRAASLLTAVTSIAMFAVFIRIWRARDQVSRPAALEGALLLTLIPLLSPQGWDYGLLVSAPAVMLIVNYYDGLPQPLRWLTVAAFAAIGLSIYDVLGRVHYMRFVNASGVTISYFVVIVAIVTLRIRRLA